METLKAQLTRIQEQLAGLTATQKMLTASLMAIMVMTLMWWSHYAATPEMVPLLNESMTADDIGRITQHLEAEGISNSVVGDKIMVPADKKLGIIADLSYSKQMPRDNKSAFNDMIKEMNPFQSTGTTDAMMLNAKEESLNEIISNFPGAADAHVMIDPTEDRNFDGTSVQPSATVTLTTQQGDDKTSAKQLAAAAADAVSGAQAGLLRSRITVVVDGKPYPQKDQDDEDLSGGDGTLVDNIRQNEDFYCDKISKTLADIGPGLMVSVTVKLDNTTEQDVKHTILDPKTTIHQEVQVTEHSEDSTGASSGGGEPGATPNLGVSLGGSGGGGGSTDSTTENETSFANDHGTLDATIRKPPGEATVVAASVRVPRSYLVQAYKNKMHKDADDAALAAFTTEELGNIRATVKACTNILDDNSVVVADYSDPTPVETTTPVQTASSPVATIVGSHAKEIGVGALAAMSLFMVSMMVRKGAPAPVLVAAPVERPEPVKMDPGEDIAGEVSEGGAVLEGMELDEGSVKTQQVVTQVQQMVTENPDAAANLVKRWLNHR